MTEMVTGEDLVEWQLLVASGQPLPLAQEQLSLAGHAFEARVYAERPEAGFLPGSGTLHHLRTAPAFGDTYVPEEIRSTPAGNANRLDSSVEEGSEVSVFYDPMLAKVIVRGPDRPSALQLLRRALAGWQAVGVPTNVPFLRRVLDTDDFASGEVHTAFIDQHSDALLPSAPPTPSAAALRLSALHWLISQSEAFSATLPAASVWSSYPFLRLNGGVCGGAGASPLSLQPLGFDGEAVGEPTTLLLRASSPPPGALAAFEAAPADAPDQWAPISLMEWCGSTRRFRALVGDESVGGNVHVRHQLADGDAPASAPTSCHVHTFLNSGEAVAVEVTDVAQQARRPRPTPSPRPRPALAPPSPRPPSPRRRPTPAPAGAPPPLGVGGGRRRRAALRLLADAGQDRPRARRRGAGGERGRGARRDGGDEDGAHDEGPRRRRRQGRRRQGGRRRRTEGAAALIRAARRRRRRLSADWTPSEWTPDGRVGMFLFCRARVAGAPGRGVCSGSRTYILYNEITIERGVGTENGLRRVSSV